MIRLAFTASLTRVLYGEIVGREESSPLGVAGYTFSLPDSGSEGRAEQINAGIWCCEILIIMILICPFRMIMDMYVAVQRV